MAAKFELKKATDGTYYFHLKAENGRIVLASETYNAKSSAEDGIASVRANSTRDERYARKMDSRSQPYFVLTATNGQVIGTSEMYVSDADLEIGIAAVKADAGLAEVSDLTVASS